MDRLFNIFLLVLLKLEKQIHAGIFLKTKKMKKNSYV